jgi:hypothetical protein
MTEMLLEPAITIEGSLPQGAWQDGYTVLQRSMRTPSPERCVVLLEVRLRGAYLDTISVDLPDMRSRTQFAIALAARNGTANIAWEKRLGDYYHNLMVTLAETHPPRRATDQEPPIAPPLPAYATFAARVAEGAAPWLDAYIAHSAHWSPRAADAYHAGIGLWMLSGVAAGRVAVELGALQYPNLFLALVSRSTLYAKTTTAKIGRNGLRQAGCGRLLAPDRSTPQALIRSMAGAVPADFSAMSDAAQLALTERIAFAGQRTWYYEEWGTMLHHMARTDSPVSEFHGLIRHLDDGEGSFESDTIARGLEHVQHPYLALLCSATPPDLAPFMRPGAPFWHDGFWPRFAFLTPRADELPSRRRHPRGLASLDATTLVMPLQAWHQRLGIPKAHIEEITKKGKGTGRWRAVVEPDEPHILTISDAVLEAYYAYNSALLEMVETEQVSSDLDASYGRFHIKALRVAVLLASMGGHAAIAIQHWAYAQTVVEDWRRMLHQLVEDAGNDLPLTREEVLEEKIERMLGRHGECTARNIRHGIRGYASREIDAVLTTMVHSDRITLTLKGKASLYSLPSDTPEEAGTNMEEHEDGIPF